MNIPAIKTRFAPSPTGLMHLGNARTALFNVLMARAAGGHFLLRIEDTDRERSRPGHVEALQQDLRWLGLDWQEGPGCVQPPGGAFQSGRVEVYAELFAHLEGKGDAYPCFCSERELARVRAEQRAAGRPPRYPGICARLSTEEVQARLAAGERPTLRFRVGEERTVEFDDLVRGPQRFRTGEIGDFVIRRADGSAAFFFSNAVDDALMRVTHVLRGEDHLTNTPRQLMILQALELPAPRYGHIGLIVGGDGAPLSKRNGSRTVAELRDAGYLPEAVINYLARVGHHFEGDDRLRTLDELARGFRIEGLGRAPSRFDAAQLDHWQAEAVLGAPLDELRAWLTPGSVPPETEDAFLQALRPNVRFPAELRDWAARLFGAADWCDALRGPLHEAGGDFFRAAIEAHEAHGADWTAFTAAIREATGRRGRRLFMPLRLALTGCEHGPELAAVLRLLSSEGIRVRLRAAARTADAASTTD